MLQVPAFTPPLLTEPGPIVGITGQRNELKSVFSSAIGNTNAKNTSLTFGSGAIHFEGTRGQDGRFTDRIAFLDGAPDLSASIPPLLFHHHGGGATSF